MMPVIKMAISAMTRSSDEVLSIRKDYQSDIGHLSASLGLTTAKISLRRSATLRQVCRTMQSSTASAHIGKAAENGEIFDDGLSYKSASAPRSKRQSRLHQFFQSRHSRNAADGVLIHQLFLRRQPIPGLVCAARNFGPQLLGNRL